MSTKNNMARVVVQALYNLAALPPADHQEVVKRARHSTVEGLTRLHEMACMVLGTDNDAKTHYVSRLHHPLPYDDAIERLAEKANGLLR